MPPPTPLIIGSGIAGPILAILLKRKGYHPLVFEKVPALGDAGASLMLMPNGMKILNLITPTTTLLSTRNPLTTLWHGTASGDTTLGESNLPSTYTERYTQPAMGIKRTELNLHLKELLVENGIPLYEGYNLCNFDEDEELKTVMAYFTNGERVTGSFLVGCDGIKSSTRRILLSRQGVSEGDPVFTGLLQVAGISRGDLGGMLGERGVGGLSNWYGEGVHVVGYPVSSSSGSGDGEMSWAVTLAGTEVEETWKAVSDGEEMERRKAMLREKLVGFEPGLLEMVERANRIISYGLFDRAEVAAEQWFSSRAVLVGDAAHPTSPHLGQGGNQALEDCYHLSRLLPDVSEGAVVDGLEDIFGEFARLRQPHTAALVKQARHLGEQRVVLGGPERCRERDAGIVAAWSDQEAVAEGLDRLFREPF
ncbi:FAD/NAD(P)-binding domain-containing protein [Aspergillus sclerotioniger CBS 115572]|uniref:FAD/NAD(P)-binding domain-containing protein n=1 Tax=Aspergillus sclerotioniger CBS 115572 TaxID=1450535 RepID=A0A317X842_9EURO|nr:FAD/NAD(P)-binding domain-containing protein [Aspergillus sclerotioniger CBS 115572]PWY93068.1 FAD/NAD(P)-binding domain-containing protein [Aspergillus sclerotioniger CBS 115572]